MRSHLSVPAVTIASSLLLASSTNAAITIVNSGFEQLNLGSGAYAYAAPGWTTVGDSGTQNSVPFFNPGAIPQGTNTGFIGANQGALEQTLSATFERGSTYALDFFIGRRLDFSQNNTYIVTVFSAARGPINGLVGRWENPVFPAATGLFLPVHLEFSPTENVIGEAITLRFERGPQAGQFHIDDVTLNAVPTPSSAALLGVSTLIATRRRRR